MTDRYLTADEKLRLCKALLKINSVREPEIRNIHVSALEADLGHSLNIARHAEAQYDLFSVVTACQSHPGALRAFVSIVLGFNEGNVAAAEVDELLAELEREPLLRAPDRNTLVRLLRAAQPDHLASALQAVVRPEEGESYPGRGNILTIVRRLEMAPPEAGRPPVLLFAEHVAHQASKHESKSLHEWIDRAGSAMGLAQDQIRQICLDVRRISVARFGAKDQKTSAEAENSKMQDLGKMSIVDMGDPVPITSPAHPDTVAPPGPPEVARPIRGTVPIRNQDFTGRDALLQQLRSALETASKASVLPRALHGLGGVGKTQLAVEYVYRFTTDYDLVWWISAEQRTLILTSLSTLCDELGLPRSQDQKQTAEAVLRALSTSPLRWLLVFDNADDPDDIVPFVPSAGGHVIITSRNQAWTNIWDAIEVNVFDRQESIELVRKRGHSISAGDADLLSDKLGDLPLALDQAATWQAATGMPVSEYLELFDEHVRELMAEGKPTSYPTTVAAFVSLAFEQLRSTRPVVAQLLELFAFLGAEPISVSLLRRARQADISEPLRGALQSPIELDRTIRDLGRYGLAKVDPNRRIQVHRLVQMVLREGLSEELKQQARSNVQNLFASANPADPDAAENWPVYETMTPHILPAGLADGDSYPARQVVLDQIRYLYMVGNYEGSQRLAEISVRTWNAATGEGLGPDGELTLIATRHLANALRDLGEKERARQLDSDTLRRLQDSPQFGPEHEHALATAMSVAVDLRVAGEYREALNVEKVNVERHRRVFGDDDPLTLRALRNLAVDLRMLSDFQGALEIDEEQARYWQETVGENDDRYLYSVANLAIDLYGRGRYAEALELQRGTYPALRALLGQNHHLVLWAARAIGIALRKTGNYKEALTWMRENYRDHHARLGPDHERTLNATMSYANTLRAAGELSEARAVAADAVQRFQRNFGAGHPYTLVAKANLAIILRALGELREAHKLDRETLERITSALGAEHAFTLCVANNLANDLSLSHELRSAREHSGKTLALSRRIRGDEHPYTLACATNAALDLQATGDEKDGQELLDATVAALARVLGPEHPDTVDAARFKRAECDIEPPPT